MIGAYPSLAGVLVMVACGLANRNWHCTRWLDIWGSGRKIVQPYHDSPQYSVGGHAKDAIDVVHGMVVPE